MNLRPYKILCFPLSPMIQLPGDGDELLTYNGKPVAEVMFPEIGCKVKARITKVTFTQASLQILEVEGKPVHIEYKAILKPVEFNQSEYLCDKLKKDDAIDCVVVSYGDSGIFVALNSD